VVRSAFTLIELIFAIVVIAIAVISLPMMTQATSKGIEANMVQEAIFAASAELNQAVTANWDEASIEPGFPNSLERVIDDGNCTSNPSSPRYRLKPGHIVQPYHRRCLDSNTTAASNASTNAAVTSLDDMEKVGNIFDDTNTDAAGYKKVYTVSVAVDANVNFNGANTNMKKITVSVFESIGGVATLVTSLVTYSANIGEVDYYKRSY